MLNMDFDRKVVIDTNQHDWVPSPSPGVWRKPLAREDAESGHTTSIVRFDPGSYFSRHEHPLGEDVGLEDTAVEQHRCRMQEAAARLTIVSGKNLGHNRTKRAPGRETWRT